VCERGGGYDGKKLLHSLMSNEIGCMLPQRHRPVLRVSCIHIYIHVFSSTPSLQHHHIPCPKRGCRFLSVWARKLKTIQQIIDFYLANGLFHFRHLHTKEIDQQFHELMYGTLRTQLETYTHEHIIYSFEYFYCWHRGFLGPRLTCVY